MADKAKERRQGGRVTVLRRRIFLIAVLTMAMLFGVAVGINLYILRLNEDANRSSNQSDLRMVQSFLADASKWVARDFAFRAIGCGSFHDNHSARKRNGRKRFFVPVYFFFAAKAGAALLGKPGYLLFVHRVAAGGYRS